MRISCLAVFIFLAGTSLAFAGTDDGDTPNPFTEPSAGQTTTSGLANTGDASARQLPISGGQGSGLTDQQPSRPDETSSSGNFYQEQKKDTDGH